MAKLNKICGSKIFPFLIASCGAGLLLFLLYFNQLPANDTVTRYAPMARAFAQGDWIYAYHPHSGILFSTLSGIFAWLGMDGYRACQFAALLLWSSSAMVFYCLALRLWHKRSIALIAEMLYLLCSHLHRMVYDGIRDNGRSLGGFLLVWGILWFYEERHRWKPVLCTAAGAAILGMLRVDGGLFAGIGICCFLIFDILNHGWKTGRSVAVVVLFFVLITPQLYLNYCWSGYPVLNSRYALILEKLGVPPLGKGIRP